MLKSFDVIKGMISLTRGESVDNDAVVMFHEVIGEHDIDPELLEERKDVGFYFNPYSLRDTGCDIEFALNVDEYGKLMEGDEFKFPFIGLIAPDEPDVADCIDQCLYYHIEGALACDADRRMCVRYYPSFKILRRW